MTSDTPSRSDRVWLITGCSSGIGRALCEEVLARGERVVCTARRIDLLEDFERRYPGRAAALRLDVADPASIEATVAAAMARFGRIDVLVNNAGYGVIGALEEVADEEIQRIFQTNVLGVIRMTKAVLPHMRAQGSGHILNVSSALGFVVKGGYSVYCASKFAVEGVSEALAQEVAPFGIKVTILAPGSFRTDFRGAGLYQAPVMPAYEESLASFRRDIVEGDGHQPGDPKRGAVAIIAAVDAPEPPLRLALGRQSAAGAARKAAAFASSVEAWNELSVSADFPS